MTPFIDDVRIAAEQHRIPLPVLCSLIKIESNWNPWAFNPEPPYRYLWDLRRDRPFRTVTVTERASEYPPTDFSDVFRRYGQGADHEWWGQQMSWGLMQVMGAVARERGFREPYLAKLSDPATNLDFGCRHLRWLLDWSDGNIEQALAAYNGGMAGNYSTPYRNAMYVERVMAWHDTYLSA